MDQSPSLLTAPLVITGCGILSPIGVGFEAFTRAITAARDGKRPVTDAFETPMPAEMACYLPDFEARTYLGKKGTTFFDRLTALTVATCHFTIEASGWVTTDENRDQIGIVLGSSMGSVKSIGSFTRETLIQERPYLVNAILFPNTVMNCAAGQSAIWLGLQGLNSTISGGQTSSLMALRYATTMLRRGYVEAVLVGGAEELSQPQAWGFSRSGLSPLQVPLGEGCAMFMVEPLGYAQAAGRLPVAEVMACETGVYSQEDIATGFADCIRRSLVQARISPEAVWAVSGSFRDDGWLDQIEETAIGQALGQVPASLVRIKTLIGECYSAAGAFQMAALLSRFQTIPANDLRYGLVTSISHSGSVCCAVIKEWIS